MGVSASLTEGSWGGAAAEFVGLSFEPTDEEFIKFLSYLLCILI